MLKFKKSEDYYVKSDIVIKQEKDIVFGIPAGTPLKWVVSDRSKEVHRFEVRNLILTVDIKDSSVSDYVVGFGEEAQRAAASK
jgi:hypothetical protein